MSTLNKIGENGIHYGDDFVINDLSQQYDSFTESLIKSEKKTNVDFLEGKIFLFTKEGIKEISINNKTDFISLKDLGNMIKKIDEQLKSDTVILRAYICLIFKIKGSTFSVPENFCKKKAQIIQEGLTSVHNTRSPEQRKANQERNNKFKKGIRNVEKKLVNIGTRIRNLSRTGRTLGGGKVKKSRKNSRKNTRKNKKSKNSRKNSRKNRKN
jgi:hypothetical protein